MNPHSHFFGCPCTEFVDYHGIRYCVCCGLRDRSNNGTIVSEKNEDRASACDATPSPLEAEKEPRDA